MADPARPTSSEGSSTAPLVTLDDIEAAHERIAPIVPTTPTVRLDPSGILLKVESLHPAGSFKIRGATHCLLRLPEHRRGTGVVAHSSGNHAIAVAHAARLVDVHAVIVMPEDAPRIKIDRTRAAGAEVVLVGPASDERVRIATEIAERDGRTMIEPYDHLDVIAATGTIALELLRSHPEVREIHVPISGGGLAAGVAAATKHLDAQVRVIGVEPEIAADARASRTAGHVVTFPAEQMARTIADGLRVQQVGTITWPHLEAFVDDIVTVTEGEIRAAMRAVASGARLVAEPSGAVPVASAMLGRAGDAVSPGRRAAILCGGNVDLDRYRELIGP